MSAARMPGADERAFRTLAGQRVDTRTPWKLPPQAEQFLLQRTAKADQRRFAATPVPLTGFADLEDTPCTA